MVTTRSSYRHLLLTLLLAANWFCLFSPAVAGAEENDRSQQLIATLLADNERWLQPSANGLSYTFRMKHADEDDLHEVRIRYGAPDHVTAVWDGKTQERRLDNTYDTNNCAYAPKLLTILQGITWFGPLQELALAPEHQRLTEVGDESVVDRPARVLRLRSCGTPSDGALSRWAHMATNSARVSKYWYVLTPATQDHQGKTRAVIQAECLFEEGPKWGDIQKDLCQDPTSLTWRPPPLGRYQFMARTFRAFLLPSEQGDVPFILEEARQSARMWPAVLLTEGERSFNAPLHDSLEAVGPQSTPLLSMRIGCGVWSSWYGYSGGGATEDKIWVDRSTGSVLREEGYREGNLEFSIEYGDFEQLLDGKRVPRHVRVRLLGGPRPWSFDMRFSTHGGKIWLLRELIEHQGEREVARAWVSDVQAE